MSHLDDLIEGVFKIDLDAISTPDLTALPLGLEYLQSLDNHHAFEKATKANLDVVIPDDRTLTLDIDTPTQPEAFFELREFLNNFYRVEKVQYTKSKSGNMHIYITMTDSFTPLEKIALQACLGSDPKREILSFVRAKNPAPNSHASLMFETAEGMKLLEVGK
jgi:hypothetical protein